MNTSILVALIAAGGAVISNLVIASFNSSKTIYRIEQLEKKQDKHNAVIERTYKLEEQVALIDEKIKVGNHRIDDLEKGNK